MQVSTKNFAFKALNMALSTALATLIAFPLAAGPRLKSFKDDLFAYPGILEMRDNGDWIKVDYSKQRDIYGRDEVPLSKVKGKYISRWGSFNDQFETVTLQGRTFDVYHAGKVRGQNFTVIFIHGRGVDNKLAANDYRFGGNFNRIKNLAVENDGAYMAPTIKSFDAVGVADTAALIRTANAASPGKPIVIACASMGAIICAGIARDPAVAPLLKGIMIMGGAPDPGFPTTAAHSQKVPLVITHGSWDSVYKWQDQESIYNKLHAEGYPTRFVLFETGKHGSPIRMTDWRSELNWIFAHK
ncbi:alpha/beta hydrolase [Rhizobium sp. L1K21]|uniref:alpha/beta hydrolase n=1 Tax=Rhizobium sp. L1K21 TaxID=2954933 RepID=UPI0020939DA5|nr:alpha/beta hydrolase [Rhizobium sp. L1K21]MCO6186289.1 alpha/beta hydrolase [Rhizobium sp. L1K21]